MSSSKESLPQLDVGLEYCSLPIVMYDVTKHCIVCSNKATKELKIMKLDLRESLHENTLEGQEVKGTVIIAKKDGGGKDGDNKKLPKNVLGIYTLGTPNEKMVLPCSVKVLTSVKHYAGCGADLLILEINLPPYCTGRGEDCFYDYTSDGFWDWYPQCDYEYLSPGFWAMFGYDPSEMPHKSSAWQALIHPKDLERTIVSFDAHVKSRGKKKFFEKTRYKHKKGHYVTVLCRGTVVEWLPNTNLPWRVVGTHTDISEALWIQSSKVREKLISQLSHDLKTPLCVLIAICEKQFKGFDIQNRGKGAKPTDVKKANDIWESERSCFEMALQHLVELTNDLQYFTNDEYSHAMDCVSTAKKEVVDLHALFLCTCKCIQMYANMSKTSILMSVDTTNVPQYVHIDKRAIARLMYNLGSNAVRHGPSERERCIAPLPVRMHLSLATEKSEDKESGEESALRAGNNQPEEHEKSPRKVFVNMVVSNSTNGLSAAVKENLKKTFAGRDNLKNGEEKEGYISANDSGTLGMSIVYSLLTGMKGNLKFTLDEVEVKWLCTIPVEIVDEVPTLEESGSSSLKLGLLEDYMPRYSEGDHTAAETNSVDSPCSDYPTTPPLGFDREDTTLSHSDVSCCTDDTQSSSIIEKRKGSVLVVEDEPIVSRLMSMWMLNDNWDCVVASNGMEALSIVYKEDAIDFDFVLLDLHMPDINGFEFLQNLKDKGRPRSLMNSRILVTSAYITDSTWKKLHDLGAFDRIDKPYRYNHLQTYLFNTLKAKTKSSSAALSSHHCC